LLRCGDLGALCDDWAGWTLNRLGLHDPAGRTYRLDAMRAWWITAEQARFWRQGHRLARDSERLEGASTFAPAVSGQGEVIRRETARPVIPRDTAAPAEPPLAAHEGRAAAALPARPPSLAETAAAEAGAPGSAAGAGRAGSPAEGRRRRRGAGSAPQGAGLVSSLKQVATTGRKPKPVKASRGVPDAR
jgi:hypothetical protein